MVGRRFGPAAIGLHVDPAAQSDIGAVFCVALDGEMAWASLIFRAGFDQKLIRPFPKFEGYFPIEYEVVSVRDDLLCTHLDWMAPTVAQLHPRGNRLIRLIVDHADG